MVYHISELPSLLPLMAVTLNDYNMTNFITCASGKQFCLLWNFVKYIFTEAGIFCEN